MTQGTTIVAQQAQQTLESLVGGDTLLGVAGGANDTFLGTAAGLNGDVIGNFGQSNVLDITDVLPTSSISYLQGTGIEASQGTLSFGASSLTLQGVFDPAKLQMLSDGGSGTLVRYLG